MSHSNRARVVRWIDGDTVVIDVDSWPGSIEDDQRIRLSGYDAPERGKRGYHEARNRAIELAPPGTEVGVVLDDEHAQTFDRLVGHIIPPGRATSISVILTEEHLTKADFL